MSKNSEEAEKLTAEFQELCRPLNEWLQRNYHPHARIIIESDHAEVVEGAMVVPFKVID
jgi:hypothetical protein